MARKNYIGSGKKYVRYSDEQIRRVRQTDMLDFLGRHEGFTFKKTGKVYTCVQHDSLIVQADRQRWFWNSRTSEANKEAQGLNVLDYLEKMQGYTWQQAMAYMLGDDATLSPAAAVSEKENKASSEIVEKKLEFKLPEKCDGRYNHVFAYLCKTRCIAQSVVAYCVKNDLIYQEKEYNNCVFVGYDANGEAKFAESKVTNQFYKQFNINVEGSDKRYSFNITNQTVDADKSTVFVFEAPVDLLSHCTMYLLSEKKRAAAENRPANKEIWLKQNRLSLSGKSDVALETYLENNPETKQIVLCLDNDYWGQKACKSIGEKYSDKYKVSVHHAKYGKDYNECLQLYVNGSLPQKKEQKILSHDKIKERTKESDNTQISIKSHKIEGLEFIHNGDYSGFAELNGERIVKFSPFKSFFRVIKFEKSPFGKSQNDSFVDNFDEVIIMAENFAKKLTGIDNDELVIDDKAQRSR